MIEVWVKGLKKVFKNLRVDWNRHDRPNNDCEIFFWKYCARTAKQLSYNSGLGQGNSSLISILNPLRHVSRGSFIQTVYRPDFDQTLLGRINNKNNNNFKNNNTKSKQKYLSYYLPYFDQNLKLGFCVVFPFFTQLMSMLKRMRQSLIENWDPYLHI